MPRPARTYPPHQLGRWGEARAAEQLARDGWVVLERSYRLGRREVDLIATRDGVLAFVEVKTRAGRKFGVPEAAVTHRKRLEIEAVARDYLMRQRPPETNIRFDVVAIEVGPGRRITRLEHIEDAWRPSGG